MLQKEEKTWVHSFSFETVRNKILTVELGRSSESSSDSFSGYERLRVLHCTAIETNY